MKGCVGTMIGLLVILSIIYIVSLLPFGLWLRKSNIKNWWLVFIPFAQNYKLYHYVFDTVHLRDYRFELDYDQKTYIKERRKWSWGFLLVVIVLSFVIGGMVGMFGGEEVVYNSSDMVITRMMVVSFVVNMVSIAVLNTIQYYSMYRTVQKKSNNDDGYVQFSRGKSIWYVLLGFITFGAFQIIAFYVISLNNNYKYIYNGVINELGEMGNV